MRRAVRSGLTTIFPNATQLHPFGPYLCCVRMLIILYTFYIAGLACYPCTDGQTCVDEVKSSIAVIDTDGHAHSDAEKDLCSPFCICSCCRAQIQQPSYYFFDFHAVRLAEQRCDLRTPDIQTLAVSIWQPPKVA